MSRTKKQCAGRHIVFQSKQINKQTNKQNEKHRNKMLLSIIKSLGFVILLIIILSITNHFLMNATGYKIPDFSRGYFCGVCFCYFYFKTQTK